jgi:hypothetical protein
MHREKMPGVQALAAFVISPGAANFKVLSVAQCDSAEEANHQVAEARKNPLLAFVTRNGSLVMTCTFMPPDEAMGAKARDAFLSFASMTPPAASDHDQVD